MCFASGTQDTEVVEEGDAGGKVRVTTMERTLVDVMAAPQGRGTAMRRSGRPWCWSTSFDLPTVAAYCDLSAAKGEPSGSTVLAHGMCWP